MENIKNDNISAVDLVSQIDGTNGDFEKEEKGFIPRIRENPWIVSTILLFIVFIGYIFFNGSGVGNINSNVVSENMAAENLISFIKDQSTTDGDIKLVSTVREGELYKVTLNYQGQDVPVYVSLDGKFLISDVIPLDSNLFQNLEGNEDDLAPATVELGDSPIMGDKDALITLVEFSDYQCPFCERFFKQTLPLIEEQYIKTGKVKLVFKDFPLGFHENAQKAAEAARCAREQKGDEGYFKMHDKLFENQQELSVENYKKWARSINGIDGVKFDKCLDDGKYVQAVKDELAYGESLGVTGTPAFFINGKIISGAQPFDVFKQAIDSALKG